MQYELKHAPNPSLKNFVYKDIKLTHFNIN